MMNSMLKPVVALVATVLIGASVLSPAVAATKTRAQHVRTTTTVQQQMPADSYNAYNQYGNGSWSDGRVTQAPFFGQGGRCITDEGYGRWSYCDSGN